MAIFLDVQNIDIDTDALLLSDKILLLFFVAVPVISNLFFIASTIYHQRIRALKQSRHTIRLSMAVGGISFGMFSMLIICFSVYEQDHKRFDCVTVNLSRIYEREFLPVVYSFGLILLAVDIVVRSKVAGSTTKSVQSNSFMATTSYALLAATLPWITALALVGPLSLTGIEWNENCHLQQSETHLKAILIACGIVPSCVAFVITVFCLYMTKRSSKNLYEFDNPMADCQDMATIRFPTTSLQRKHKNRYVVEMENAYDPKQLHTSSDLRNSDSSKSTEATVTVTTVTTNDIEKNDQCLAFAQRRYDDVYQGDAIHSERLVISMYSLILLMTVVPYNSLYMYIMDTFPHVTSNVYQPNKDVFIAGTVLAYVMSLYPILMPFISLFL